MALLIVLILTFLLFLVGPLLALAAARDYLLMHLVTPSEKKLTNSPSESSLLTLIATVVTYILSLLPSLPLGQQLLASLFLLLFLAWGLLVWAMLLYPQLAQTLHTII